MRPIIVTGYNNKIDLKVVNYQRMAVDKIRVQLLVALEYWYDT